MALIVQKFGGTSVADPKARACIVAKLRAARARGDRVVLVVSAMGRRGAPYATDTLLDLLRETGGDADPATSDLLVSTGEVISACILSALLRKEGIPSIPMTAYTAGIETEGPPGDATPIAVDAAAICAKLDKGLVPIITGFQGLDSEGGIVTLGRGGSDTSAVAVGIALGADFIDIYTDVPGVAKADPRVATDAPYMDFLDYGSMFRLATHGARVLHDRSALLAEKGRALLRVRSTFDEGEGTLIGPEGTRKVPDFVGIGSVTLPEGKLRLTAVFAKGSLGSAIAASLLDSEGHPGQILSDDPDALAFVCTAAAAGDLTRRLLESLK